MKNNQPVEFENDQIRSVVDGKIVTLHLKSNAFYSITNIDRSREILNWFDAVAADNSINTILLLNEPGCFGNTAYQVYIDSVKDKDLKNEEGHPIYEWQASRIRTIEINILNNFINTMLRFPKVVIIGLSGTVVTSFFGASLAADFRFVSPDTNFSLSHNEFQLHAGGALPFFLPKYIGHGKAVDFLIRGGTISASTALELGLVNEIFSEKDFRENCIRKAKETSLLDPSYIKRTKDLMLGFRDDFRKYADNEGKYVEKY
jgi:enoyl-CoA hydratase/carnithine racemase